MKIHIVIHDPHKSIIRCINDAPCVIRELLYNILINHGIDEELAINCANWAETASYGDSYNEQDFDVYIEEN